MSKKNHLPEVLRGKRVLVKKPIYVPAEEKIILSEKDRQEKEEKALEELFRKIKVELVGTGIEDPALQPGREILIDSMGLRMSEPVMINNEIYLIVAEQHVAFIW